jgi:hypothetical protein
MKFENKAITKDGAGRYAGVMKAQSVVVNVVRQTAQVRLSFIKRRRSVKRSEQLRITVF